MDTLSNHNIEISDDDNNILSQRSDIFRKYMSPTLSKATDRIDDNELLLTEEKENMNQELLCANNNDYYEHQSYQINNDDHIKNAHVHDDINNDNHHGDDNDNDDEIPPKEIHKVQIPEKQTHHDDINHLMYEYEHEPKNLKQDSPHRTEKKFGENDSGTSESFRPEYFLKKVYSDQMHNKNFEKKAYENLKLAETMNLNQINNPNDTSTKDQKGNVSIRYSKMSEEEAASAFEFRKKELMNTLLRTSTEKRSNSNHKNKSETSAIKSERGYIANENKPISVFNAEGKPNMNNFIIFSNNSKNPINSAFSKKDVAHDNITNISSTQVMMKRASIDSQNNSIRKKSNHHDDFGNDNKQIYQHERINSFSIGTPANRSSIENNTKKIHISDNKQKKVNPKLKQDPKADDNKSNTLNSSKVQMNNNNSKIDIKNLIDGDLQQQQVLISNNQHVEIKPKINEKKENEETSIQVQFQKQIADKENVPEVHIIKEIRHKNKQILENINDLDSEINKLEEESKLNRFKANKTADGFYNDSQNNKKENMANTGPQNSAKKVKVAKNIVEKNYIQRRPNSPLVNSKKNNSNISISDEQNYSNQYSRKNSLKKLPDTQDDQINSPSLYLSKKNQEVLNNLIKKREERQQRGRESNASNNQKSGSSRGNSTQKIREKDASMDKKEQQDFLVTSETENSYATLNNRKYSNRGEYLFARAMIQKEAKKLIAERTKEQKDMNNMRECTFSPNILTDSSFKNENIVDKTKRWQQQKKQQELENEKIKIQKELDGCKFYPNDILLKNPTVKFDFDEFYKRNIDWVKKKEASVTKKKNDFYSALENTEKNMLRTQGSSIFSRIEDAASNRSRIESNSNELNIKNQSHTSFLSMDRKSRSKSRSVKRHTKADISSSMIRPESIKLIEESKKFLNQSTLNNKIFDMNKSGYTESEKKTLKNDNGINTQILESYALLDNIHNIIINRKEINSSKKNELDMTANTTRTNDHNERRKSIKTTHKPEISSQSQANYHHETKNVQAISGQNYQNILNNTSNIVVKKNKYYIEDRENNLENKIIPIVSASTHTMSQSKSNKLDGLSKQNYNIGCGDGINNDNNHYYVEKTNGPHNLKKPSIDKNGNPNNSSILSINIHNGGREGKFNTSTAIINDNDSLEAKYMNLINQVSKVTKQIEHFKNENQELGIDISKLKTKNMNKLYA